jgi:hypothetical protein
MALYGFRRMDALSSSLAHIEIGREGEWRKVQTMMSFGRCKTRAEKNSKPTVKTISEVIVEEFTELVG